MAQSFITDAGSLVIPGAYATIKVQASASGLATTGVLMLVGEADAGPDYSKETEIGQNAFGPDDLATVLSKYKSGPLVDAFRGAAAAANDPQIVGSFSRCVLVKTNPSTKATALLKKYDGSTTWGTLEDRSYGQLGNLISREVVVKQAEVIPTTGAFAYLPAISSTNIDVRVNGGAASAITLAAQATPTTVAAQFDAVPGVDVTGGVDVQLLGTSGSPLTGNLAVTVISGNTIRVDFSNSYGGLAPAGSTLWIPTGSPIAGASNVNCGSYIVTGSTGTTVTARKLIDASGTPNQLTPPGNVSSTAATGNTNVMAFTAISVSLVAANPIDGVGKTLEINELTSGVGLLSYLCYTLGTSGPVAATWVSKASAPQAINSGAEYIAQLNDSRQLDSVTESLSAGGAIGLQMSYKGTSATAVNDGVNLTITVVGGAGTSPGAIKLADWPSIADLAGYINSLTGFKAAPGTAVMGSQPSKSLDQGSFTIGSTFGSYSGRIKQDAYKFFTTLANNGVLVELSAQPVAGLPGPNALSYLSGGTKSFTTDTTFNAAVDACEQVRGNFLVPLFSRDAVNDIADNLTDTSSTYTIANVHAYSRAHVLKMSTLKRRRNRQAFLSIRDSFTNAKNTAANMASFRCAMPFQDVRDVGAAGIVQFQSWMAAVKAASMQAAGFYRPIVHKGIAISGALQAAGDFSDQNDTQLEDALLAGLLPIQRDQSGGFLWVSDQTTYGKDSNFVFNSIQATYVADVIALTLVQRMELAFVGQSLADVSASLALATLEGIMDDLKRLKLITASDDAPKGFKNASVKINVPAMLVAVEVKLAGAVYFIPITALISQVQQSAGG